MGTEVGWIFANSGTAVNWPGAERSSGVPGKWLFCFFRGYIYNVNGILDFCNGIVFRRTLGWKAYIEGNDSETVVE
jgi:hypothetical protein